MKFSTFAKFSSYMLVGMLAAKVIAGAKKRRGNGGAEDRHDVEHENMRFREAVCAGRAEALAELYAPDAVLLPPNRDIIMGREDISLYWQGVIQQGVEDAVLMTIDVHSCDDTLYEIGRYDLRIQAPGKEAAGDRGKYVVIWKRMDDGSLKIQTDIWNSNMPRQPGA